MVVTCRSDPVVAALARVENRCEDAGRVETRCAVPVDRAVGTDKRDRVEVSDYAMFRDGQVVAHSGVVGHRAATLQQNGASRFGPRGTLRSLTAWRKR